MSITNSCPEAKEESALNGRCHQFPDNSLTRCVPACTRFEKLNSISWLSLFPRDSLATCRKRVSILTNIFGNGHRIGMASHFLSELLSFLDGLPEPRIVMDADYRIITANAA